jgi:hypothetical protein
MTPKPPRGGLRNRFKTKDMEELEKPMYFGARPNIMNAELESSNKKSG